MKIVKKFGIRLKAIRKLRGLSQEQLAELAGFETAVSISKLEAGEHFPKKENLDKLCNVLNIEVKDLFDFAHLKSKPEIVQELTTVINSLSLKDLQYLKRVLDAYLEAKQS